MKSWFEPWRSRRTLAPLAQTQAQLQAWFDSALGEQVLASQLRILEEELSCLFGYHLLQLSVSPLAPLCQSARISQRITVSANANTVPGVNLACDFDQLPLADESVDVTLLHHVLEFSPNPHQLLKEASRVTIPRGHIIILGFNPHSLQGVVKPFARLCSSQPIWRYKTLSAARVTDWLAFLECTLVRQQFGFVNWPVNRPGYLSRTAFLARALEQLPVPLGNFYCLVARKDVAGLTPLRPRWPKDRFMPLAKPAVAARSAARLTLIKGGVSRPDS
jgi:SAM-dependent methyltransferase